MDNLANILEGILFCAGDPIEKSLIKEKLEITEKELNKAITELEEKFNKNESGIILIKFNNKLQFASNSIYSEKIDLVLKKTKERALSKTIMETLAIIAYKQPVTRLEIETIRGGAPADYALRALLEHKLITIVGRKESLGRPLLFGTTDEFLKRFDLENLTQLPDFENLINQINEIHNKGKKEENIYNEYDIPEDEITSQENFVETLKENEENIKKITTKNHNKTEDNIPVNAENISTNNDNILENNNSINEENNTINNNDNLPDFIDEEDEDYIEIPEIKEYKK